MTSEQAADGLTAVEWNEATGWPDHRVNTALRSLHKAGRLRRGKVRREAIDGSMRWVTTYAVTK